MALYGLLHLGPKPRLRALPPEITGARADRDRTPGSGPGTPATAHEVAPLEPGTHTRIEPPDGSDPAPRSGEFVDDDQRII